MARQLGDLARLVTSPGCRWPITPEDGPRGALVHFGSLDFIVTTDGGQERIQTPTRPDGLDTAVEVLRGLQLHPREGDNLPDPQQHGFDSVQLERQLQVILGPRST